MVLQCALPVSVCSITKKQREMGKKENYKNPVCLEEKADWIFIVKRNFSGKKETVIIVMRSR